jgi:hypothetical protein
MLVQLLVGGAASIGNIMIHAAVMAGVIKATRARAIGGPAGRLLLVRVMVACVTVLMAAHVAEVAVWAAVYALAGVTPAGSDRLYFAFVNYTTLGYGDITPAEGWRLMGPMAAMNGVLMFGWSTAVIFEVLRRTLLRMDEIDPV